MNIKLDVPIGKYFEFTKEELLELNRLLKKTLQKHLISQNPHFFYINTFGAHYFCF